MKNNNEYYCKGFFELMQSIKGKTQTQRIEIFENRLEVFYDLDRCYKYFYDDVKSLLDHFCKCEKSNFIEFFNGTYTNIERGNFLKVVFVFSDASKSFALLSCSSFSKRQDEGWKLLTDQI